MKQLERRPSQARTRDEAGASAVEYALLVVAIAAVIVAVVFILGDSVLDTFQETCDGIHSKGAAASSCASD